MLLFIETNVRFNGNFSQIRVRWQRHVIRPVRHRRDHRRHPFALQVDIARTGQVRAERDRRGRRCVLRERRGYHPHQYRGGGRLHHGRERQQTSVPGVCQIQSQSGRRRAQRQSCVKGIKNKIKNTTKNTKTNLMRSSCGSGYNSPDSFSLIDELVRSKLLCPAKRPVYLELYASQNDHWLLSFINRDVDDLQRRRFQMFSFFLRYPKLGRLKFGVKNVHRMRANSGGGLPILPVVMTDVAVGSGKL